MAGRDDGPLRRRRPARSRSKRRQARDPARDPASETGVGPGPWQWQWRRRRRGRRLLGCFLWLLTLLAVLLVLSVLFGGFHRGSKAGDREIRAVPVTAAAVGPGGRQEDPRA
jgi:cell division septal protein FtsQ